MGALYSKRVSVSFRASSVVSATGECACGRRAFIWGLLLTDVTSKNHTAKLLGLINAISNCAESFLRQ